MTEFVPGKEISEENVLIGARDELEVITGLGRMSGTCNSVGER